MEYLSSNHPDCGKSRSLIGIIDIDIDIDISKDNLCIIYFVVSFKSNS